LLNHSISAQVSFSSLCRHLSHRHLSHMILPRLHILILLANTQILLCSRMQTTSYALFTPASRNPWNFTSSSSNFLGSPWLTSGLLHSCFQASLHSFLTCDSQVTKHEDSSNLFFTFLSCPAITRRTPLHLT
jgi:hypothetical protein